MSDKGNAIGSLVDIALGLIKDKALNDVLVKIESAEREYLIAEADARRKKNNEVIKAIVKVDSEKMRLEKTYSMLKPSLDSEARCAIDNLLTALEKQRGRLVLEKRKTSGYIASEYNHLIEKKDENINGIPLQVGDVLAVTRKGGLYQHYAIYVGDKHVIHYAAETGDFSGKISIHEAPFSEFQAGDLLVYVLDFPNDKGIPIDRVTGKKHNVYESELFDSIRSQGYHLYSPEETVKRAYSRVGEEQYSLPFNNCEHFAIWCKTGVKESHQVNVWLSKILSVSTKLDL